MTPSVGEHTIGLDLGTSRVKAARFDAHEAVVREASEPLRMNRGADGSATQSPQAVADAARRALDRVDPAGVLPVGVGAAMHSFLPVDARGRPLIDALTWADPRGVTDGLEPLRARTGCLMDFTSYPARLRWLAQARPDVFHKARRFLPLKTFVLQALAAREGVENACLCDEGLASTTGLLPLHEHPRGPDAPPAYDPQALETAGVDADRLPRIVPGETRLAGRFILGSSDGALANLGAGPPASARAAHADHATHAWTNRRLVDPPLAVPGDSPGATTLTLGTSGAVRMTRDQPLDRTADGLWCYRLRRGRWVLGAATSLGGLVLQWTADLFFADEAARRAGSLQHSGSVMDPQIGPASRPQRPGDHEAGKAERSVCADASSAGRDPDAVARLLEAARRSGPTPVRMGPHLTTDRGEADAAGASLTGLRLDTGREAIARAAVDAVTERLARMLDRLPPSDSPVYCTGSLPADPFVLGQLQRHTSRRLLPPDGVDASTRGAMRFARLAAAEGEIDARPSD